MDKQNGDRLRIRLSNWNTDHVDELVEFLQRDFPSDIRNYTDAVNFALQFFVEYVMAYATENDAQLSDIAQRFVQSVNTLKSDNLQKSINYLNENVEKLLLLELNSLSVDASLPPEVRANMIGPLREGSAGYIANQRLREISEAVKKRQINANKSGAMK
ncbi:hypothetical protein HAU32_08385 [Weissella confusa]|uniref:Uncharacterized protein n=2 Tax=Weissella TaxID=46255 RepID=A0ABT6D7I9_9LACO|nr:MULTISPECIES: hypothetical protein [Weissella]MBJ7688989.1 hypothetical protein [Weissella confusa]MDF9300633.1 hypothetical protein [Weissella sp. BK2]